MRLVLDRIAENANGEKIATFECGDSYIDINEKNMPNGFIDQLEVNHIVEAEIENGVLLNPKILFEETKKEVDNMRVVLNRLRNRNKW